MILAFHFADRTFSCADMSSDGSRHDGRSLVTHGRFGASWSWAGAAGVHRSGVATRAFGPSGWRSYVVGAGRYEAFVSYPMTADWPDPGHFMFIPALTEEESA